MMRTIRRGGLRVALAALTVGLAAGCGSEGTSAGSTDADGVTTVKVGLIPITDVAPLYLGVQKGFFSAQKLKIEPQLAAGGAAIVPAVMSNSNQFGFSNNVSLIIAKSKGVPLRVITPGVGIAPNANEACQVLAPKDGDIRDVGDLAGKSVAVNTLNNIGDVTIRAALEKRGVDPNSIQFTELGFPDMVTAVDTGRIDAAWECEPFVTTLLEQGARPILNNYADTHPNLAVASYFTSTAYAKSNPDVVRRFDAAVRRSQAYANAHPDEVRAILPSYAKIPPAQAKKINMIAWPATFQRDSIEELVRLSEKYKLIKKPVRVEELIQEPAG
ncbi:ABC transporter substrate-binding protein [Actinomadura madurae]|uniref:ABC transporter substrate-binding protein n=1 Tax=Actinomadura madurae TaxID=1993 RepID=UPI000D8B7612|nr:ABC transporter substrate-binding protein [Actinomadura madurae]SPT51431.1 Putative aliphatic sulfonates-binding protein precursor [Actinomadura madurae]